MNFSMIEVEVAKRASLVLKWACRQGHVSCDRLQYWQRKPGPLNFSGAIDGMHQLVFCVESRAWCCELVCFINLHVPTDSTGEGFHCDPHFWYPTMHTSQISPKQISKTSFQYPSIII